MEWYNSPPPPKHSSPIRLGIWKCGTGTAPCCARRMDAQLEFAGRVQGGIETAGRHASSALLAQARAAVPLETLRARAAARVLCSILAPKEGDHHPVHLHDAFLKELLAWFKSDFFTWVNSPPCCGCGGSTTLKGMSPPTDAERAGLAGRVEAYGCDAHCGASETRFPRYNDPGTLLRTRRGRCGEWANCFTLVAKAAGLTARYVLDWSDHVWTEVWAPHLGRWVHADACEAAHDTPHLYEQGWGKKLSYVLAFEAPGGVADVTPRYVLDWGETLRRRTAVQESWLAQHIARVNLERAPWAVRTEAMAQRADADELQLAACMARGAPPEAAEHGDLPGRQSGAMEWRAARGELGTTGGRASTDVEARRQELRTVRRLAAALARAMTDTQ
jgi:peptide-N4-(N-acetyl-beta-glucosaminyl)asparagine amidase